MSYKISENSSRISIHALRVEGDCKPQPIILLSSLISIHALRVEGDGCDEKFFKDIKISIHALRVEGDK